MMPGLVCSLVSCSASDCQELVITRASPRFQNGKKSSVSFQDALNVPQLLLAPSVSTTAWRGGGSKIGGGHQVRERGCWGGSWRAGAEL